MSNKETNIDTKLPAGWEWKTLGEVVSQTQNINPLSKPNVQYTYIDISSINNTIHKITNPNGFIGRNAPSRAKKQVQVGDILFATTRPNLKNIASVEIENDNLVASTGFCILRVNQNTSNKFLFKFLLSVNLENQIEPYIKGAQYPAINDKDLLNCLIPIPPLTEQNKIVSVLESTFSKIDKSIELVKENVEKIKQLNASVLDEVFVKLEKNNGKMCSVSSISNKIQYGFTGQALDKGKYYYLRITDIQKNAVEWEKTPFSDISEKEVEKYLLNVGDIVFARTGATSGKSYLFKDKEKSVFASYLIRVVVKKELVLPEYLYLFFQSTKYWEQVNEKAIGSAQPNVNGQKLGQIILPIPNLIIQKQIIKYAQSIQNKNTKLLSYYQTKLLSLQQLKNSVLESAFKGELRKDLKEKKNLN